MIGPASTDQTVFATSLLNNYNVGVLSISASAAFLSVAGFPSFLRIVPSDAPNSVALALFMQSLNWSLVIPVFSYDAYGQSAKLFFLDNAIKYGLKYDCLSDFRSERALGDFHGAVWTAQQISDCVAQSPANVAMLFSNVKFLLPTYSVSTFFLSFFYSESG